MSLPTFIGTTSKILWNQELINYYTNISKPSPPNGYPYGVGDSSNLKTFVPSEQTINWSTPVPIYLNNITLNEIFDQSINGNFLVNINYVFTVTTGIQYADCLGQPNLNFNIYTTFGGIQLAATNIAAAQPVGSSIGYYSYPYNNTFPTYTYTPPSTRTSAAIIPLEIQAIAWNASNGCSNWPATNMTVTLVAQITLIATCSTESQLNSPFCLNYCTQKDNQELCFPVYKNYCLVETTDGEINIFSNTSCQSFFSDYLSNNGPKKEIDDILTPVCSQKFPGFESLISSSQNYIDICACHLNEQLYVNLKNSLVQQFPGFQYVPENQRCLFPPCASSVYTTDSIGKKCLLPGCINIASITNNGTINGKVELTQDNKCADAANQTGNNTNNNNNNILSKSFWEEHWMWIILGAGILIVLIIVIIIVVSSEKNKKKSPNLPVSKI